MRIADPRALRSALIPALSVTLLAAAAVAPPHALFSSTAQDQPPRRHVDVIQVTGAITPITVQQIERQIERSQSGSARALVLVMDTRGGLESSMRSIVQAILASPVPVITYV